MRPTRLFLLLILALPGLLGAAFDTNLDTNLATNLEGPWASESAAAIHPGVRTVTAGSQCTANFVFEQYRKVSDRTVREVFIGQAAHCASRGANTSTDGCATAVHPLRTTVQIEGGYTGTLVYSSWHTMQARGETNADRCRNNDFALVRIKSSDFKRVNPTIPVWGGPRRLGSATAFGESVYTYGRSGLRFGLHSDRQGVSLGTTNAGWSHRVYTATPGIPGDSGSAFLDENGNAIGVLSTVAVTPYPASNGVSDLGKALAYMKQHTNRWDGLYVVPGTRSFDPGPL